MAPSSSQTDRTHVGRVRRRAGIWLAARDETEGRQRRNSDCGLAKEQVMLQPLDNVDITVHGLADRPCLVDPRASVSSRDHRIPLRENSLGSMRDAHACAETSSANFAMAA
jgi:hypothetical protein